MDSTNSGLRRCCPQWTWKSAVTASGMKLCLCMIWYSTSCCSIAGFRSPINTWSPGQKAASESAKCLEVEVGRCMCTSIIRGPVQVQVQVKVRVQEQVQEVVVQ